MEVLSVGAVDDLIGELARRGYTVVGPTVQDGAIVLDEIRHRSDLPEGWGDIQEPGSYRLARRDDDALFGYAVGAASMRPFLRPPYRRLWSADRDDGHLRFEEEPDPRVKLAFFGVRPCDLAAVSVDDRVFGRGPPGDGIAAARENCFVVAVNCGEPASTCFCTSTGTGPAVSSGYDIALTELLDGGHRFAVEAATDAGRELVATLPTVAASAADTAAAREVTAKAEARIVRRLEPDAHEVLAANLDHARWAEVADRCLSCASCTLVCPTCFCSTVEDANSIDGRIAERFSRWDSCFTLDHSYVHGAGAVRSDIRSRYRQWLTHKLSTWWDQFGVSGCVGCGRCITWCPAGIDLTEEVAAIAGRLEEGEE